MTDTLSRSKEDSSVESSALLALSMPTLEMINHITTASSADQEYVDLLLSISSDPGHHPKYSTIQNLILFNGSLLVPND